MTTIELLKQAKSSCHHFGALTTNDKNKALESMAKALLDNAESIISANKTDIENAQGKIAPVMIDRLMLNKERVAAMAQGVRDVANLPDPVGEVLSENITENGLKIQKVRAPIGVVAIIYESRPNVTSDAAALCFKSSNVCVLRGGKEAFCSNKAIVEALHKGLQAVNLPTSLINLVRDTSRESATQLMKAKGLVDLLIPRGGKGLIDSCVLNATVPCIETGTGICHIYIDRSADFDTALNIIDNAKTNRPSVCNAAEVCVVDKAIAQEFLPLLHQRLTVDRGEQTVQLRLDTAAAKIIDGTPAGENDFDTEFLDYILAIKVADNVDDAINHINAHSTMHSEAIVATDAKSIEKFKKNVDSSSVYVNASTRFTDGGVFGLGCEMGISTQKIHARGPMGLEEMTSYKYVITGQGHIR